MEVGHLASNKSDNFFSQSAVLLFRASNKNRAGANHLDKSDNFFSQSTVLLFRASNKSDFFFDQSVCPFNESDIFFSQSGVLLL
jgi:hypothetical protein